MLSEVGLDSGMVISDDATLWQDAQRIRERHATPDLAIDAAHHSDHPINGPW